MDGEFDEALDALRHCDMVSDEVLFAAILRLSTYHLEKSKAYGQCPVELMRITCGAYRRLNARYAGRYERPYAEKLWTGPVTGRYEPFRSAVFYEHGSRAVPVPPGRMTSRRERDGSIGRGIPQLDAPAAPMGVRSVTGEYVDYYEYRLTSERCFIREGNQWREERSYSVPVKSRALGVFTRASDRLMRDAYGVRPGLKAVDETKTMVKFIEEAIDEQKAAMAKSILEQQKAQRPKIEFDLSLLDDIRKSSDAIGQRLMTEEERGTEAVQDKHGLMTTSVDDRPPYALQSESEEEIGMSHQEKQAVSAVGNAPSLRLADIPSGGRGCPHPTTRDWGHIPARADRSSDPEIASRFRDAHCVLSGDALRFMQLLLYDGNWKGYLSEKHIMVSVLAEAINEQLYDEFADVVIEFDGDVPVIVEDYLDDLKGMIPK
ncbi:MAG: hypothetical protein LUF30_08195 [Lachnospiraceae bacterium]|nr:hypothetical protein [Lachnospiraceae bacterium]